MILLNLKNLDHYLIDEKDMFGYLVGYKIVIELNGEKKIIEKIFSNINECFHLKKGRFNIKAIIIEFEFFPKTDTTVVKFISCGKPFKLTKIK